MELGSGTWVQRIAVGHCRGGCSSGTVLRDYPVGAVFLMKEERLGPGRKIKHSHGIVLPNGPAIAYVVCRVLLPEEVALVELAR